MHQDKKGRPKFPGPVHELTHLLAREAAQQAAFSLAFRGHAEAAARARLLAHHTPSSAAAGAARSLSDPSVLRPSVPRPSLRSFAVTFGAKEG